MSDKVCGDQEVSGRRRSTIVSFSKDKDEISIDGGHYDDEDFQIALAPYIQTYLALSGETLDCCGVHLPVPFERASKTWWDLKFDSEILEGQYRKSSSSQIRLRFRFALGYMILLASSWSLYLMALGILDENLTEAFPLGMVYGLFVVVSSLILVITRSKLYRQYTLPASILISLLMCSLSLASIAKSDALSPASDFAICIEVLLLIYTVIPLPLYLCVIICIAYSVAFEMLGTGPWATNIFLHACVHLIGLHIFIMANVRMRGTFMRVGQSLLVRKQLEMEKQVKEKMIHWVMPQQVAAWLLEEEEGCHFLSGDFRTMFRPFNISCMKDVSILFADIVGFTRMSSNKTASQLVAILNELFERFDELCVHNGCEKISTLGDCYYCVSGCPTPRPDHAQCCVDMGSGMIKAIAEFDREKQEDINMRVGVHTGTVLCGIVGRRRFKFDVWSNDVTLANKMESTGIPGKVHISEATKRFLGDLYVLDKGEEYHGMDTYFIVSKKDDVVTEDTTQVTITSLTSNTILTTEPSFETALMSATDSLVTAASHAQSPKSSSNVNCTVSPFDTINDSRLFSEDSATQSSPTNATPNLLCISDMLPSDVKATSLPNVFARDSGGNNHHSMLGSGPILTRKPLPSWKYSRLKLNSLDVENGKVQRTYKITSSGEPSPIEKATNYQLEVPKDDVSFCHSVNSRKDSGIRSNSRRSSIQPQLFALTGAQHDQMNHRVSGYYTSSHSSLNGSFQGKFKCKLPVPFPDSFGSCFQKIRKQSDLQLIRCVQDNSQSERNYFIPPPLKRWSLLFKYPEMEKEYREKAHRESPSETTHSLTLATARFNTYLDITISLLVFSSICAFLFATASSSALLLPTFLVLLVLQLAVISVCLYSIVKPVLHKAMAPLLNWYPWHILGALLVSLPLLAVLSNYEVSSSSYETLMLFTNAVFVGIIHYCNFTQLNCWIKSSIASLGGLIYLVIVTSTILSRPQLWAVGNATFENHNLTSYGFSNTWHFLYDFHSPEELPPRIAEMPLSINSLHSGVTLSSSEIETLRRGYFFMLEIHLTVFLLVLLVWLLNREFEVNYRLSFHGNVVAAKDKAKVEEMKIQAETLLYNIIPKHVAEQFKMERYRYSEDIKNAGIIFASVINFAEMYDESYLDGMECLRVLNELVSDFDDLLSKEQFSTVEKIKTIGATFMAASGLNPSQRKDDLNEHLFQLMEFAFALLATIDNFNVHLLGFDLVLRVGYNFGDVTAGVIGTRKLHYDIWGDAVNIASRMDSTGVANRIQVPVSCVPLLTHRYNFEHRGTVYVKGKDHMDVYLVKDKIVPPNQPTVDN